MNKTSTVVVKLLVLVMVATSIITFRPLFIEELPMVIEKPAPKAQVAKPIIKKKVRHVVTKSRGNCNKYESIITSYKWPVDIAMQICKDESHGDPENINWHDSHKDSKGKVICISSQGLYQIACFWPAKLGYTKADLLDPEKNVAMAFQIWKKSGFFPWSTYKN